MFIENDISQVIDLNGDWSFRLGKGRRRAIHVPSAWEASQRDKVTEEPAHYRRTFHLDLVQGAFLLEADAISFAATVRVNGQLAGEHTGMWSRFQIDITALLRNGLNEIEIEVWKPGETRYKLRESLAGFLPDVCNTFGGIWQGIRVRRLRGPGLADMRVATNAGGMLQVAGKMVYPPQLLDFQYDKGPIDRWIIGDMVFGGTEPLCTFEANGFMQVNVQCGDEIWPATVDAQGHFTLTTHANAYATWSPAHPSLHELKIDVFDDRDHRDRVVASVKRRIGFREVAAQANQTLLNRQPIHLRGALDWGWDEKRLCPTPARNEVLAMFAQAKSLGFNLWKLCLFVPDESVFDAADEMGMLLWLELPMWQPAVTPALRELAKREYAAILQRVHHHPSIVVVSLGCEMNADVDADFLHELGVMSNTWLPNALRTDNSGSSEAYGGVLAAGGDFYDYHFYTDPHFFQPLIDHFRRPAQPDKPWIFGEFCDADTQRNWIAARTRNPFWLKESITFKREELDDARNHETLLRKADVRDGAKTISEIGKRQADETRKFILEQTRRNFACGGYVVTSWRDTPIATSSIVDDAGALKVDAALWQRFNADRVLLLDRERRRAWTHGGDRPVPRDPFTWFDDEPVELHVSLANGAAPVEDAVLEWQVSAGDAVLMNEAKRVVVGAGVVSEIGSNSLTGLRALSGLAPAPLQIEARLAHGGTPMAHNTWTLWRVPRANAGAIEIYNAIDEKLLHDVSKGKRAFVWLQGDTAFTKHMPFWRESIHVFAPAFERIAGMGAMPCADLRFFGIGTDLAIDAATLKTQLAQWQPRIAHLWRRFDARRMVWHEYAVAVRIGKGRLVVSSLRFAGGLGHQPCTLETNPMGAWLLRRLAE